MKYKIILLSLTALGMMMLGGCSTSTSPAQESEKEIQAVVKGEADVEDAVNTQEQGANIDATVLAGYFEDDALVEDIEIVDCTLSDGTETSCYKIVATQGVTEDEIGPRCPRNIADSDEAGGIWLDDGEVYAVDGEFIKNLATFYDDAERQLYNEETGDINVTDTKEAFEGAAKPQVEEQYQNHCVEGLLSYVEGTPIEYYYIPVDPEKSDTIQQANNQNPLGVAFNGIRIEAPAPVENILAAHTIAAFDDCGGHVNPVVGYHYHAENGCAPRIAPEDKTHADLIGYALDGFQIYEYDESLTDLDTCGGHSDDVHGYHYHLAYAGKNQQLGCFSGGYGCVLSEDGTCDASATEERRGPPPGGTGGPPSRD